MANGVSICLPFSINFPELHHYQIQSTNALRHTRMSSLCDASDEPLYPKLILTYWSSLSFDRNRGFVGTVLTHDLSITREKLAELLNSADEGEMYSELWQRVRDEKNIDEVIYCMENPSVSQRALYSSLTLRARVLHLLLINVLFPRQHHLRDVLDKDLFIMYSIKNEEYINVVHIVYNHLASDLVDNQKAIPYGFLVTKLLRGPNGLPLLAWNVLKEVVHLVIGVEFFRSMGIAIEEPLLDESSSDDSNYSMESIPK